MRMCVPRNYIQNMYELRYVDAIQLIFLTEHLKSNLMFVGANLRTTS